MKWVYWILWLWYRSMPIFVSSLTVCFVKTSIYGVVVIALSTYMYSLEKHPPTYKDDRVYSNLLSSDLSLVNDGISNKEISKRRENKKVVAWWCFMLIVGARFSACLWISDKPQTDLQLIPKSWLLNNVVHESFFTFLTLRLSEIFWLTDINHVLG